MHNLEPPDSHYLRAAIGWMELGLSAEAEQELAQISPAQQRHPDVLGLRWSLFVMQRRWEDALAVAEELLERQPANSSAWVHHAYSVRRASGGGLQQAWGALLPAAEKFPDEPIISFNLACYACQLGHLEDARSWLQRAMKIGRRAAIKQMALADDDLKPMWPEIQKL
jgi:Flp pilus assembly protein TadD